MRGSKQHCTFNTYTCTTHCTTHDGHTMDGKKERRGNNKHFSLAFCLSALLSLTLLSNRTRSQLPTVCAVPTNRNALIVVPSRGGEGTTSSLPSFLPTSTHPSSFLLFSFLFLFLTLSIANNLYQSTPQRCQ